MTTTVVITVVFVGWQMPLYAAGVGETLTPFSLAGVVPPLTFSWSISNRQIAQLKSAFHTVCVQ